MAQVVTRCRLTGHYMFMAMEVDPRDFERSRGPFARKFCPFCSCEHFWPIVLQNSLLRCERAIIES